LAGSLTFPFASARSPASRAWPRSLSRFCEDASRQEGHDTLVGSDEAIFRSWGRPFETVPSYCLVTPNHAREVRHARRICLYDLLDDSHFRRCPALRGTADPVFNLTTTSSLSRSPSAHGSTDRDARDHALPLGASGRGKAKVTSVRQGIFRLQLQSRARSPLLVSTGTSPRISISPIPINVL
jgi:hypothetical protein